jgi:hypothetical protein
MMTVVRGIDALEMLAGASGGKAGELFGGT